MVVIPPLGYDGSIAYPWCPPQRVRSRRVGHSVTGMLRIPVLSNVTCNVEHIFYNQKVSLPKAEPLKYVFYANDSILVTKLHVRAANFIED